MPEIKPDSFIKMPVSPKPVISIGAGGIVREGHQPAYRKANWDVIAVYDPLTDKARQLANDFGIPDVYGSLEEVIATAPLNAVFDIYEILPGFILSSLGIVVVSLLDKKPSAAIQQQFDQMLQQVKNS